MNQKIPTPSTPISVHELEEVVLAGAARVYAQGLLLETPPGSTEPFEELARVMRLHLLRHLRHRNTRRIWVGIREGHLCGILDFYHRTYIIHIRFLCGIPTGQGIGTQIMAHLARYAIDNNIALITATVSSLDERAMNFYFHHLRFRRIGFANQKFGFDLFFATTEPKLLLSKTQ